MTEIDLIVAKKKKQKYAHMAMCIGGRGGGAQAPSTAANPMDALRESG